MVVPGRRCNLQLKKNLFPYCSAFLFSQITKNGKSCHVKPNQATSKNGRKTHAKQSEKVETKIARFSAQLSLQSYTTTTIIAKKKAEETRGIHTIHVYI